MNPKRHVLSQWFYPSSSTSPTTHPRGVVLLVHGLNLRPEKLDQLSLELTKKNWSVYRSVLRGHSGESENEILKLGEKDWESDFQKDFLLAQQQAKLKNIPLVFIGYSLGGLLGVSFLLESAKLVKNEEQKIFEKLVLLAPALELRWYTSLVQVFNIFGPNHIVNSWNPSQYRANRGSSMAAYKSLFKLHEHFHALIQTQGVHSLNLPTLLLIDPSDELISYSGLKNLIKKQQLSQWKIELVSNKESRLQDKLHHLIVDEESLGKKEWMRVVQLIEDHLMK